METGDAVEKWCADTLGLDGAAIGRRSVERTLSAAVKRSGAADAGAYLALLAASPEESERFLEELVVPETWFFRDSEPFVFLRRFLEREWLPSHPNRTLRVLSAPCSTGEEPYSIAMTLLETGLAADRFTLDAADISRKALTFAKKAHYGRGSFRQPLEGTREVFFRPTPRGMRIAERVTGLVRFCRGNLIRPDFLAAEGPYDVIFCRNIFIYLTAAARRQLLANVERLLAPDGILFTGHAEMGILRQERFTAVRHPRAFACRRGTAAAWAGEGHPRRQRPSAVPAAAAVPLAGPGLISPPGRNAGASPAKPPLAAVPPGPAGAAGSLHAEALALADRGRIAEAEALCRRHLRERPHADVYCLLGLINEAARRPGEAEECYLKALYLDPDHYESLIHVSLLYRQQGNDRKARTYRRRAEMQERRSDGTDGP
ncbi:MAG: CheR family methyltransferase [Syntrophales bacterium]